MADEADRAQAREEEERVAALARHQARVRAAPRLDCIDCGEPIPEPRRRAHPEARRCISCQQEVEGVT